MNSFEPPFVSSRQAICSTGSPSNADRRSKATKADHTDKSADIYEGCRPELAVKMWSNRTTKGPTLSLKLRMPAPTSTMAFRSFRRQMTTELILGVFSSNFKHL